LVCVKRLTDDLVPKFKLFPRCHRKHAEALRGPLPANTAVRCGYRLLSLREHARKHEWKARKDQKDGSDGSSSIAFVRGALRHASVFF
jgi:hypothetical protein